MQKTGKNFECQTCGKSFYRSGWQIKRNPQKFCSLDCRRHTPEARSKMSESHKGRIAWNKGLTKFDDLRVDYYRPTKFKDHGKSSINMKIRKSTKMLWWRKKIFLRDDYTCQQCGQRGGKLNADHIKPFCLFPQLRFDLENGQTLCEKCHLQSETFGRKALKYVIIS